MIFIFLHLFPVTRNLLQIPKLKITNHGNSENANYENI